MIKLMTGVCILLAAVAQTIAGTPTNELTRLSKVSLQAMECSHYAAAEPEIKRLEQVGLEAGQKFLNEMAKLNNEEREVTAPYIANLWLRVSGRSTDFILGRVWQEMESAAYKSLGQKREKWPANRERQYNENNCLIVR
jgi:hypothetical protein